MQVKKESNILKLVMMRATEVGITLWRNNVGKAWMGKKIAFTKASVVGLDGRTRTFTPADAAIVQYPRIVTFGLTQGASDLIGVEPYTVKTSDVGRKLGLFVAMEVKTTTGRASQVQKHFLEYVESVGGRAYLVRSPDDVSRTTFPGRLRNEDDHDDT